VIVIRFSYKIWVEVGTYLCGYKKLTNLVRRINVVGRRRGVFGKYLFSQQHKPNKDEYIFRGGMELSEFFDMGERIFFP
jgi:hypothetical protein